MKDQNLIRLALVFLASSCVIATIGLLSENKISDYYDQIEQIDKEKKLIQMWQLGFSDVKAESISAKILDEDFYLSESSEIREINRCIRYWHIAKGSTLIEWAIEDYSKFSVQKFYDPVVFSNTKTTLEKFLEWNDENRNERPCLQKENRIYIFKAVNELTEFYPFFEININKILSILMQKEEILNNAIIKESNKAGNLYFATFLILILSTILIIYVDVKSNRGSEND